MELRELVGGDEESFPWARALLLALALQLRSGLLLLGLWLGQSAGAFPPVLGRLRLLPAHPDWYLAALVQNLAVGVVLVWIIRRLAIGWGVALAAIAGSLAWLSGSQILAESSRFGIV